MNFSPALTNWLPFYWAGFQASVHYTYRIEDLSDLDRVQSDFQEHVRRGIRKAESLVQVDRDFPLDALAPRGARAKSSVRSTPRGGSTPRYSWSGTIAPSMPSSMPAIPSCRPSGRTRSSTGRRFASRRRCRESSTSRARCWRPSNTSSGGSEGYRPRTSRFPSRGSGRGRCWRPDRHSERWSGDGGMGPRGGMGPNDRVLAGIVRRRASTPGRPTRQRSR